MSSRRCPLCKTSYKKRPKCGLLLFNSENECAICLEKPGKMVALPCGHQFCEEDLKRLGIFVQQKKSKKKKKRKRESQPEPRRRRRVSGPNVAVSTPNSSLRPAEGNRCGFCGHLGHTIRTCDIHKDICGCVDFRSVAHIMAYNGQRWCSTCCRHGHEPNFCSVVVLA